MVCFSSRPACPSIIMIERWEWSLLVTALTPQQWKVPFLPQIPAPKGSMLQSSLGGWVGVLPQTDFFSGWASREYMCRLRAHLNELEQSKANIPLGAESFRAFPSSTDFRAFPSSTELLSYYFSLSGKQSLPFIYRIHLICYILRENDIASLLCTRAEDQSSWVGNLSIN